VSHSSTTHFSSPTVITQTHTYLSSPHLTSPHLTSTSKLLSSSTQHPSSICLSSKGTLAYYFVLSSSPDVYLPPTSYCSQYPSQASNASIQRNIPRKHLTRITQQQDQNRYYLPSPLFPFDSPPPWCPFPLPSLFAVIYLERRFGYSVQEFINY